MAQAPPTVTVTGASEVGVTSARVEGTVYPEGEAGSPPTYFHFEVSADNGSEEPDGNWMWVDGVPSGELTTDEISGAPAEESNPVPVEGAAENLQPAATYYVRLVADNAEFANHVESPAPYQSFTTDPATAPALVAKPVDAVGYTLATLHGTVNPRGGNVNPIGGPVPIHWQLQYSPKGQGAWNTAGEGWIEGAEAESSGPIPLGPEIAPGVYGVELAPGTLTPGREYEARVFVNYLNFSREAASAAGEFQTTNTVAPTAITPVVASITPEGAHFSAEVNPNAPKSAAELGGAGREEEDINAAYSAAWHFQCEPSCGQPSGSPVAADNAPHPVEADVAGFEPHQTYHVKLVASNGGAQGESASAEFQTEAVVPQVAEAVLPGAGKSSMVIRALVNPHNLPLTDCRFVWGVGSALDHTVTCDSLPTGNRFALVAAQLSNLEPGTEYSFRLLVATAAGPAETGVRHFTTSAGCANESFRIEQGIQDTIAACRAYEKASPADKGQGDIVGDGLTTVAARAGDAVAFNSRTPFGDTVGSGTSGQTNFVARRSDDGWATHAITPTGRPDAYQTFFAPTRLQIYSDDLRRAVVQAYDLPGVTGDSPLRNNIYVEDLATRDLQPVTVSQAAQPTIYDILDTASWGISADAHHVSFVAATQFLPDAAPGVPNVYQWDDGALSLAGILPDGTVSPSGSDIVPNHKYRGVMSADGSRLVFTVHSSSYGPSQLFMRIGGTRTAWLSQPELTDDPQDPSDDQQNDTNPSPANLLGVTPDGHTVFFTTEAGLVDGDNNGTADLYRYTDSADPSKPGNLTMISQDGELDNGLVVGMSDDGQRVYWQTAGDHLLVWDHGAISLISTGVTRDPLPHNKLGVTEAAPGLGRVTPDGRYLAFMLNNNGATVDLLGNVTNGFYEMYLYDLENDSLRCVSCPAGPASADATVRPGVTTGKPALENVSFRPRFLSDDGHVFFSTPEGLVPEDVNGVMDTYEYNPATRSVSLLSTGRGKDPATFADASASGHDVFIVTRQRLVGADRDNLVDVYDARDGGGLPEPAPAAAPCEGEACQGASPLPAGPKIVSGAGSRGNLHAPRHVRCSKSQRKVHRKGKARCVPKHHKRHAKHNRRASR